MDSASWDSLLQRFEQTNTDRAHKQESGEPIYGVQNFELATFISHEMSGLEETYVYSDEYPGMNVSEEELQKYYASHEWASEDEQGNPSTPSLEEIRPNVTIELRKSIVADKVQEQQTSLQLKANIGKLRHTAAAYVSDSSGA